MRTPQFSAEASAYRSSTSYGSRHHGRTGTMPAVVPSSLGSLLGAVGRAVFSGAGAVVGAGAAVLPYAPYAGCYWACVADRGTKAALADCGDVCDDLRPD